MNKIRTNKISNTVNKVLNGVQLSDFKSKDPLEEKDVLCIIRKATATFSSYLSEDEICTCSMNALWKALNKYNKEKRTKFTTYLYKGVVMECLTQKKFNSNKGSVGRIHNNITDGKDYTSHIDMIDEINSSCEDPELIYDRFYKNMTIKEIANIRGVCGETIRIKIKKNLKNLQS